MNLKEEWFRAIDVRTSRRTYLDQKMEQDTAKKLRLLVSGCNEESGLHIRFVENGGEIFNSFSSSYGMFHGVQSYFAMVGDKTVPHLTEQIGYYGEAIVLQCTSMQLGTCWVAGTYDKAVTKKQIGLSDTEELACIITVGPVNQGKTVKEKAISLMSKKKKPFDEFIHHDAKLPAWVTTGVEAVMKAPSAMNKQPVHFTYKEGQLKAMVEDAASHQGIDLGIARLHFELGAINSGSRGKWMLQNDEYVFQVE